MSAVACLMRRHEHGRLFVWDRRAGLLMTDVKSREVLHTGTLLFCVSGLRRFHGADLGLR